MAYNPEIGRVYTLIKTNDIGEYIKYYSKEAGKKVYARKTVPFNQYQNYCNNVYATIQTATTRDELLKAWDLSFRLDDKEKTFLRDTIIGKAKRLGLTMTTDNTTTQSNEVTDNDSTVS